MARHYTNRDFFRQMPNALRARYLRGGGFSAIRIFLPAQFRLCGHFCLLDIKEGSLDLHFSGSYKPIEPLQAMFTTAILKLDELTPDPKDARVYDLAPRLQKMFNFVSAVGSSIEKWS